LRKFSYCYNTIDESRYVISCGLLSDFNFGISELLTTKSLDYGCV